MPVGPQGLDQSRATCNPQKRSRVLVPKLDPLARLQARGVDGGRILMRLPDAGATLHPRVLRCSWAFESFDQTARLKVFLFTEVRNPVSPDIVPLHAAA